MELDEIITTASILPAILIRNDSAKLIMILKDYQIVVWKDHLLLIMLEKVSFTLVVILVVHKLFHVVAKRIKEVEKCVFFAKNKGIFSFMIARKKSQT